MKVLVTGGAGFIGSHLVEALAMAGHEVICLDNFASYYSRKIKENNISKFKELGVKLLELDLVTDDISNVISDADVIFHLAAQPGISQAVHFDDYERNNILATYKLLEAISHSKSKPYLIFISTSSVYGKSAMGDENTVPAPTSHYGVTKLASEQIALAYQRDKGLNVAVARLFSVYGERERPEKLYPKLISSILNGDVFKLYEGSLEHVRSYTYVSDIIAGLLLMLNQKDKIIGEIFNLGTNVTATTGEGIKIIEEIMGKPANIEMVPARSGDQKETRANINKAKKLLNYEPRINLREGLVREVEWFKKHQI